jgi:hypothetical protein
MKMMENQEVEIDLPKQHRMRMQHWRREYMNLMQEIAVDNPVRIVVRNNSLLYLFF